MVFHNNRACPMLPDTPTWSQCTSEPLTERLSTTGSEVPVNLEADDMVSFVFPESLSL